MRFWGICVQRTIYVKINRLLQATLYSTDVGGKDVENNFNYSGDDLLKPWHATNIDRLLFDFVGSVNIHVCV